MLNLLYLGVLLLAIPAKMDAQTEVKAVLALVLSDKNFSQYLAHYKGYKLVVYCKKLPLYNGKQLKPTFTITCRDSQVMSFIADAAKTKTKELLLVIEDITVNDQRASVHLRIPREGATGAYVLYRQAHWAITSSEVYER